MQHCKIYDALNFIIREMTNNVRLTINVGDTTWAVYNIALGPRQIELVTLNTICSVVPVNPH